MIGRLVGLLLDLERRDTPQPPKPPRPRYCPACHDADIHGARPCVRRPELERDPARADHDWHCHACDHSWHVGGNFRW